MRLHRLTYVQSMHSTAERCPHMCDADSDAFVQNWMSFRRNRFWRCSSRTTWRGRARQARPCRGVTPPTWALPSRRPPATGAATASTSPGSSPWRCRCRPPTPPLSAFSEKKILVSKPKSVFHNNAAGAAWRRSLWQHGATQCLCIILLSRQLTATPTLARSFSNNRDAMSARWGWCCCAWRCSWERGAWHTGWATRATAAGCCRRCRSAAGRAGFCGPPTCGPGAELACLGAAFRICEPGHSAKAGANRQACWIASAP